MESSPSILFFVILIVGVLLLGILIGCTAVYASRRYARARESAAVDLGTQLEISGETRAEPRGEPSGWRQRLYM